MFGFASLLKGIPGVNFRASDLVRNYVMSTALGKIEGPPLIIVKYVGGVPQKIGLKN